MNRLVASTSIVLVTIGVVACSNSTPVGPSALGRLDTSAGDQYSNHGGFSEAELIYISSIASTYQALFEIGKLAANNGDHAAVKFFAFQLMEEADVRLSNLREIAPAQVRGTPSLTGAQSAILGELRLQRGHELDRRFIAIALQELAAAVAQVGARSTSGGIVGGHAIASSGRLADLLASLRDIDTIV